MKNKITPLILGIVIIAVAASIISDGWNLISVLAIGFFVFLVAAVVKFVWVVASSLKDNTSIQKNTMVLGIVILAMLAGIAWYYGII